MADDKAVRPLPDEALDEAQGGVYVQEIPSGIRRAAANRLDADSAPTPGFNTSAGGSPNV